MSKSNGKASRKGSRKKKTFLPDLPIRQTPVGVLNESTSTMAPPAFRNLQELPDWLDELRRWLDAAFWLAEEPLVRGILTDADLGLGMATKALRKGRLQVMNHEPPDDLPRLLAGARKVLIEASTAPCAKDAAGVLLESAERSTALGGAGAEEVER